MPRFVIPKEIKFLSTLLPESSTKDRRPFSKINSPPISVFRARDQLTPRLAGRINQSFNQIGRQWR
jgi:hypothetical protein